MASFDKLRMSGAGEPHGEPVEPDYAAYAVARAAELREGAGVQATHVPTTNPAIDNPTAVAAPLPSGEAVGAARMMAFDCAMVEMRKAWRASRLSWVVRLDGPPGDPLRLAPYVALDAMIAACPEVAPAAVAKALGFDEPDNALDMLPVKKRDAAWPAAHVSAVFAGLMALAGAGS